MTTQTQTATLTRTGTLSQIGAATLIGAIGLAIIVLTGHVQAATLHDAAHDVRHATGFPCH